ncbi:type II secretion system F family protein [Clostridium sp. CF011]|uniref:type II secretion system F family protein n=1 Tax=Clostridium sp. CF011 TaxID=2843318 RepID=UPI001C0D4EDC|nr:type II secretion system F family protein [Clostridium sp. CF011]MBU3090565.1 type II secretion system F family protein [Clostridium sp. CF011]WAG69922.1 type II secretion system F family protein [Clostridium sp. CF011]
MPVFVYEAKNVQGVSLKGKMEASNERAVSMMLREKSYYPVRIKEYKKSLNVDLSSLKMVSTKDISIFCRQFSVIVSAGISIVKAVDIVKEQTENPKLKKVLYVVSEEIQKGKTFSISLREHKDIPDMLVNMVEVGETSGNLDTILGTLAKYYENEHKLQQKIKQAITYPKVIVIFSFIVVTGIVIFVVPTFTNMIIDAGGKIPLPTKIVMGISNFFRENIIAVTLIMLFTFLLFKILGNKGKRKLRNDRYTMKMPIFGKLYLKIVTARFARTFGILLSSGVPMIESLETCAKVLNSRTISDILFSIKEEVKKGIGLGDALSTREIFPLMLTQMIKIGEESGNMDEVLKKTADFYDDEVANATAQMTALIEPLIIIGLAMVVGFIVVSIILPIFGMYDAVGV